MGFSGCPCYNDYFRAAGKFCDDRDVEQSCSTCPFREKAREIEKMGRR